MWRLKVLIFSLFLMFSSLSFSFWIVGNSSLKKDEIQTKKELLLIFSLKKTHWKEGLPITVVVYSSSNKIHQDFVQKILGINYSVLENIWNIKIFSGNVSSPIVVRTKEEMLEYIQENEGSIGYVYSNNLSGVVSFKVEDILQ